MLLALRSLWEKQPPPSSPPFIPSASGVAVIYQLGPGWALDAPGGLIKMENPTRLADLARRMGYSRIDIE